MPPTPEQMAAAIERLNQVNDQVENALVALNQIQLEKEGLQAGVARFGKLVADAERSLADVNSSLDAATVARSGVLSELDKLNLDISGAEAELESLRNTQGAEKSAHEAKVRELMDEQKKSVADAAARVDSLNARAKEVEKQIAPLAEQVSRLTAQIASLNAQIVSLNAQISVATQSLDEVNKKTASAQQTLSELQAKSDEITSQITAKRAQLAGMDTDVAAKNAEIASLDNKISELRAELAKNSLTNADFLKARANVKELHLELAQRLEKLKMKYDELGETWD